MRRHEDRSPSGRGFVDQLPELAPRHGVDPARRLVQENHLGAVQRRHRECQFLLPAQGQRADQRTGFRAEIQPVEHLDRPAQYLHPRQPVNPAVEAHVLQHRQVVVQRETLAHVADAALDQLALAHDIVPGDRAAARGGVAQPAEHTHGSGLAGAVGAQETENLAPPDFERNAVDGDEIAEPLAQSANGYDRVIHGASVL